MTEEAEKREEGKVTFKRRSGYTAIPNHILSDQRLKMDERGFLCLIMSFAEGWVFRRSHLLEVTGWGKDKYYVVLKSLEKVGYIEKTQLKGDGGTFGASSWDIHDHPPQDDVPPCTANPDTVENVTDELQKGTVSGFSVSGSAVSGSAGHGKSGHIRKNNTKNTNTKKNNTKSDDDFSFEDFWKLHPKPILMENTEKEWTKALDAGVDPKWIMASARKYRMECLGKSKRYIKASNTWLTDKRWTDYPLAKEETFESLDQKRERLYSSIEEKIRNGVNLNPVIMTKDLTAAMIERGVLTHETAQREGYM